MNIEKVWNEYQSAIRAFLRSKIPDSSHVDDLSQDIWIKVFKNLDALESEDSVKSWMYQIANRTIIDFYRKRGREVELDIDSLSIEEEQPDVKKALSKCVLPFIHELPKEDAELLIGIDIEGVSQREYANNNDINYSTLKSRVQKSRAELREVFENCCEMTLDANGRIADFLPKSNTCKNC